MPITPPQSGPERAMLEAYLDGQREAVLRKTEGLSREQLAQPHPPSDLTLAGLLLHLALVEEGWFEETFAGLPQREEVTSVDWAADPDWEFRTAAEWEPGALRERYRTAISRSRAVCAATPDLDQLSAVPRRGTGEPVSLRWVLLHLLEETARHAGHADLLREAVDGSVGD